MSSCYCRANTNYIVKYNLQTERVEVQIILSGYLPRKNNYQWGGYSGVDLAVDEQGLWVLWGSTSNNKRLVASKIDVYQNVLIQTWSLNTGKHQKFIVLNFVSTQCYTSKYEDLFDYTWWIHSYFDNIMT